jgi:predicted nucleic acid-binding protein
MMQRIYLDTNIVLDFMLNRAPFINEVERIFKLKDELLLEFSVSALTLANVAYTLDKLKEVPHPHISKMLNWFTVVDLSIDIIQQTVVSKFNDFEDGLQYFSALKIEADVIVTRNKIDFKHAQLPVYTPQEFLNHINP